MLIMEEENKVIYDSKWSLNKKKVKIYTGDIIGGSKEWYWYYPEKDVKQCFKEILEEIDEFRKRKYQIHLVDECDCCKENLNNIFSIIKLIKQKTGDLE